MYRRAVIRCSWLIAKSLLLHRFLPKRFPSLYSMAQFLASARKTPRATAWNAMAGICTGTGQLPLHFVILVVFYSDTVAGHQFSSSFGCCPSLTSIFRFHIDLYILLTPLSAS